MAAWLLLLLLLLLLGTEVVAEEEGGDWEIEDKSSPDLTLNLLFFCCLTASGGEVGPPPPSAVLLPLCLFPALLLLLPSEEVKLLSEVLLQESVEESLSILVTLNLPFLSEVSFGTAAGGPLDGGDCRLFPPGSEEGVAESFSAIWLCSVVSILTWKCCIG